jgi:hypothetical protein
MSRSRTFRLVRRLRTLRRRRVQPQLTRLRQRLSDVWTRPMRRSVAAQLGRLARSVEAATDAGRGIAAAETRLARELETLDRSRARSTPPGEVPRVAVPKGSLPVALTVAVVALVLTAGNTWVLERHLLPPLGAARLPVPGLGRGVWVAAAFSTLALLLGLFHFALFTAGRSLAMRVLGAVALLLLIVQGGLQAAATVVAVQAWSGNVMASWAGIGALVLLAGSAGLVPPAIGATAHAALARFARWAAAREQRAAVRAATSRERLTRRLRSTLEEVTAGLASIRAEASSIPAGDPARLVVRPEPAPSVDWLAHVLRRLAVAVERDPSTEYAAPATVALRQLAHVGAVALWVLAAGASLTLALPGIRAAVEAGQSGVVAGGILAGLAALLVSGLVLRSILERPGRRSAGATGAAALLLLGIAAGSMAMGIGAFAAATGPLEGDPLGAAALLNLLILVAALGSALLPEGVRSTGSVLHSAALALAVAGLGLLDGVLAIADRLMAGSRGASPVRRGTPRAPAVGRPRVGTLGPEQDGR